MSKFRISFDLDDTLVCGQKNARNEPNRVPLLLRFWLRDSLRLGTGELISKLSKQGFEIWIYTSSYRSVFYIRSWLMCYGIWVDRIINQKIHDRHSLRYSEQNRPSKNPNWFGIDLHIDDSKGVEIEGEKHGFSVLVVSPDEPDWVEKILNHVNFKTNYGFTR